MQALGLIETRGLLPAIECADVMFKTAQVEFVEKIYVGGGLVTVAVTGDVGSVKAAVEAAAAAVEKISHLSLVSQHVIPRPDHEIRSMIAVRANPVEEQPNFLSGNDPTIKNNPLGTTLESLGQAEATNESIKSEEMIPNLLSKAGVDAYVQEFGLEKSVHHLKLLSVTKLRNLANEYKELGLAGKALAKAKKELLIQKLKGYYERGNERKE